MINQSIIHVGIVKKRLGKIKKPGFFSIASVIFIVLIAVVVFWLYSLAHQPLPKSPKQVIQFMPVSLCVSPTTVAAWNRFDNTASLNSQSDSKLINSIEQVSGYSKDPNCLFILTRYYMALGAYQKANVYLQKLNNIYSSQQGLNPAYGGKSFDLKALDNQLGVYLKSTSNANNSFASGNPQ